MGRVKRGAMLLVKIVATLAITVGLAEAASYIMYERLAHRPFSMERIQAELGTPTDGPQFASDDRAAPAHRFRRPFMWDKALHPYLGFAYRPDESTPTNSFGFFGPSPVMTPRPGHAVAGLFGGSVALGLCMNPDHGTKLIAEAIARSAFFHGKTIDVVCLAVDGYKQPQQLLALTYLLALGVRFDVVINLDGFTYESCPDRLHFIVLTRQGTATSDLITVPCAEDLLRRYRPVAASAIAPRRRFRDPVRATPRCGAPHGSPSNGRGYRIYAQFREASASSAV